MSYTVEAVVISGYRIPRHIWCEAFRFCERYCDTDDLIPDDWEDYFIDMDPLRGNDNETFFGSIIYNISDDNPTTEFDKIIAKGDTIVKVKQAYNHIFSYVLSIHNIIPAPTYGKYVGMRWI